MARLPHQPGKTLMCGIAGFSLLTAARPEISAPWIAAMSRALRHRGPDGGNAVIEGSVGLLHERLAIIDLAGGQQPLHAGGASLIANAEIYNYRELREEMPYVRFATASDCEPPLHLQQRLGETYPNKLRGMFAIAIHDRATRTLSLTRDPFGIKPLYITRFTEGIAFASEPQALLAAGLAPREIRPAARDELLQMQFTTGNATIFPTIERILPGESLLIAQGKIVDRQRVAALPPGAPETIGETQALARLERALMESVDLHQRSDVPYGLFLSGGIDSACILAAMARLNETPVLAFTAGFDIPGAADERAQAATMAKSVGAHHEPIEITSQMVFDHLPEIVAGMDDPAADYAIIPTWFLARRARQDVKVVLSGEGGDEIFGGYGRYRKAIRPWYLGGRTMRTRGSFDGLDILRARPLGWRDGLAAAETQAAAGGRSRLQAAQAADIADWLPNDLLLKLDRCLMAHGIEGRTPFLDPAVTNAGFRLPDALKLRDRQGKYLLRKWLESALPAAKPFAPKQGFTVPIATWIAAEGTKLGPLVAAQPAIAEIAPPEKVKSLFRHAANKREGNAAWMLLFYALWHRAHIEGRASQGNVFDMLAQH